MLCVAVIAVIMAFTLSGLRVGKNLPLMMACERVTQGMRMAKCRLDGEWEISTAGSDTYTWMDQDSESSNTAARIAPFNKKALTTMHNQGSVRHTWWAGGVIMCSTG